MYGTWWEGWVCAVCQGVYEQLPGVQECVSQPADRPQAPHHLHPDPVTGLGELLYSEFQLHCRRT